MKQQVVSIVGAGVFLFLAGCSDTQIGEKTKIAAATGGAIGAGLGAIVGSQTGSAGAGLAIGAAAGASAGALIGNALDEQEKIYSAQTEKIAEQEQQLNAQKSELAALRELSQDSVTFRTNKTGRRPWTPPANRTVMTNSYSNSRTAYNSGSAYPARTGQSEIIRERNVVTGSPENWTTKTTTVSKSYSGAAATTKSSVTFKAPEDSYNRGSFNPSKSGTSGAEPVIEPRPEPEVVAAAKPSLYDSSTPKLTVPEVPKQNEFQIEAPKIQAAIDSGDDCPTAQAESEKAKYAIEAADKLFHLRRALRLCPTRPEYHNALGEVYLSLNRNEDAEFEFQEALRLDPQFQLAQENLDSAGGLQDSKLN